MGARETVSYLVSSLAFLQSNHEGQIVDWIQAACEDAWLTRPRSERSRSDEELGAKVRASFLASDRTYGARRVTDIVGERFDAGVRPGETIAKDMIAVPIGPEMRMAVTGAPSNFASRSLPKKPQDFTGHNCINLRLPIHGGLYAWEFEKKERALNVRVVGQLVFNTSSLMLKAGWKDMG